jgi:gliding motility-associated protein GldM
MGHGKETPRQKMIGMMYLVLTALLALNVSKDVLNAFVLVDEGLSKTTENFEDKNKLVYDAFGNADAENHSKVGKWKGYADEVRKRSDKLYDYMQELKMKIVIKSESDKSPAINPDKKSFNGELVAGKDNTNIPSEIMVGANNNGEANKLKAAIEDYKSYLVGLAKDDKEVAVAIEKGLDTKNPPNKPDGTKESWQSEHFEHLPLLAVTTILTKMQSDVRNAESEILRYLYNQIEAGAFKFNKLEAMVIPNSNYILKGNEYSAQVFIAASDSTQAPVVYIGESEAFKTADGSIDYKMKGRYDSLQIENGKGIYKRTGGAAGYVKWGGIIRLKSPKGGWISRPFHQEYQVAEANLVISPTKMNVFYTGVDNPVDISVPGVPADKITATVSNGGIKKTGTSFIVNPARIGTCQVTVIAEIDGKKRSMPPKEFRVKDVPDPIAKIGGIKGGPIKKTLLTAQNGIVADIENFDFDLKFTVTEFVVSTVSKGFTKDAYSKSNRFTEEQMSLLNSGTRGQKIYIDDIFAVGPDGKRRKLPTISLKID